MSLIFYKKKLQLIFTRHCVFAPCVHARFVPLEQNALGNAYCNPCTFPQINPFSLPYRQSLQRTTGTTSAAGILLIGVAHPLHKSVPYQLHVSQYLRLAASLSMYSISCSLWSSLKQFRYKHENCDNHAY